jgi:hypothetical protein
MSAAHLYGLDPQGDWRPIRVDADGAGGIGGSGGGAPASVPWTFACATGGLTDTADHAMVAAAGVGKANYLVSMQMIQTSATTTEVVVKDGSTIIWRTKLAASMVTPVSMTFPQPLFSSDNAALNVTCITNATATFVSAQGYTDATIAVDAPAEQQHDGLFDDLNGNILDDNSLLIFVS